MEPAREWTGNCHTRCYHRRSYLQEYHTLRKRRPCLLRGVWQAEQRGATFLVKSRLSV